MLRRLLTLFYAPLAAIVVVPVFALVCVAVILGPTLALRRRIGRAGVRLALACIGVPIRVRGLSKLPRQPSIVVANHASYVDGLVLTAALPPHYTFVVQDGAGSWPLVGWTIRRMGVVLVNREQARAGARTTRELIRRLQAGESLAIFPEGTFKTAAGLLAFKNGAFLMAARTGVPVVPAGIRGTRLLWGGDRRLPRWSPVEVCIHTPLQAQGDERPAALALRDAARAAVLELCDEPDAVHPRPAH